MIKSLESQSSSSRRMVTLSPERKDRIRRSRSKNGGFPTIRRTASIDDSSGHHKLQKFRSNKKSKKDLRRSCSLDCSVTAGGGDHNNNSQSSVESLTQQFLEIKKNKSITRIKLHDFVDLYSEFPNALVGLNDLLCKDSRSWKAITFCDTIPGNHYREWLLQKLVVRNKMQSLQADLGLQIIFRSRVELEWQDMTKERIVAVLKAIQTDPDVTTVTLKGAVSHEDIEEVVETLSSLMTDGDSRVWEAIVFHTAFAGASRDYQLWQQKFKRCSRQLETIALDCSIPVGVKLLSTR